jgi:hypothetical protein
LPSPDETALEMEAAKAWHLDWAAWSRVPLVPRAQMFAHEMERWLRDAYRDWHVRKQADKPAGGPAGPAPGTREGMWARMGGNPFGPQAGKPVSNQ